MTTNTKTRRIGMAPEPGERLEVLPEWLAAQIMADPVVQRQLHVHQLSLEECQAALRWLAAHDTGGAFGKACSAAGKPLPGIQSSS